MMKIQNGETKNVIIPAEYKFRGWEKFGECMKSFFTKNNNLKRSIATVKQQERGFHQANVSVGVESAQCGRDTRMAAVIVKNRSQISWRTIRE